MFKTKSSVSLCLCRHRYSYITKILKTDWLLTVLIYNGNRTEWSPILSVIIRVINKIGRPRSRSPICLTTSMITDRIGRHEVMLPINHNCNKICDVLALLKIKKTQQIPIVFLLAGKQKAIQVHVRHGAYCPISVGLHSVLLPLLIINNYS